MFKEIKSYQLHEDFARHVQEQRLPAILRQCQVGTCLQHWKNPDYLKEKLKQKVAKIHVVDKDQCDKMDFISKNFKYDTVEMPDLIDKVFNANDQDDKAYYLRWIGNDPRGQSKANFHQDFENLASDFQFSTQDFYSKDKFFSSVLRISSAGIRVWTHYDIMDNIYVQVIGNKDVIMWSPDEAFNLYLDGDKSKVIDMTGDFEEFPRFKNALQHRARLQSGDCLFIPALWFHNMKAIDAGIAINIFWKNLKDEFYDKKDPYGNKDLLPAAKAMRMLDNVWHQLDNLPEQYRDFYGRQLIARLESKCLSKKDVTS